MCSSNIAFHHISSSSVVCLLITNVLFLVILISVIKSSSVQLQASYSRQLYHQIIIYCLYPIDDHLYLYHRHIHHIHHNLIIVIKSSSVGCLYHLLCHLYHLHNLYNLYHLLNLYYPYHQMMIRCNPRGRQVTEVVKPERAWKSNWSRNALAIRLCNICNTSVILLRYFRAIFVLCTILL